MTTEEVMTVTAAMAVVMTEDMIAEVLINTTILRYLCEFACLSTYPVCQTEQLT